MATMPLSTHQSLRREVLSRPLHWLPFGLGVGLLPLAPGTWGSLLAVLLFLLLPPLELALHLALAVVGFALGVWLCGLSARRLGVHDHPGIVLDEVVAMWATLAAVPRTALWSGLAFLAFRVMDIWKPWPIREADHRIPGGLGIMLDDALAAAFAAAVVSSLWKLSVFLY